MTRVPKSVGWAFFTNARHKQPPNRANTLDVFFALTGQKNIDLNDFAKFPLITGPNQDKKGDSVCRGYYSRETFLVQATRCELLTEQEISRSWRNLFRSKDLNEGVFAQADRLLDELRPESPLRHRLEAELEELRAIKPQKR
jgi:hypothetical protein